MSRTPAQAVPTRRDWAVFLTASGALGQEPQRRWGAARGRRAEIPANAATPSTASAANPSATGLSGTGPRFVREPSRAHFEAGTTLALFAVDHQFQRPRALGLKER